MEPPVDLDSWRVTPIHPEDRAGVHRLFATCSAASIRHRFRAPLPAFPARHLDELLAGPPERHDALAVRAGASGELVALGSLARPYGPNDGRTAELALLVVDPWQRRGLGRALTAALVERAAGGARGDPDRRRGRARSRSAADGRRPGPHPRAQNRRPRRTHRGVRDPRRCLCPSVRL